MAGTGKMNRGVPVEGNDAKLPLPPAYAALAQTNSSSLSSTLEITLNANTSLLEVSALDKGIFMKWGTADVTSSNFDEFIPAGMTRHYVVPTAVTAVNFIQIAATAQLILIEK